MGMSNFSKGRHGCGPEQQQAVQSRTVTAQNAIGISAQAGADAFGEGTFADTQVHLTTIDRGLASFAIGAASTQAAAQSSDGQSPLAMAYAMVDVLNADLSVTTMETSTGTDISGTSQQTAISAIGVSFAFETDLSPVHLIDETATETCGSNVGILQGNLASFAADVSAHGENSYADVQADTIALEGQYSSSTVSAISAVDCEITYTEYAGTKRDDRIVTGDGLALVRAGRGDDSIHAGAGDDWLFGEDGRDRVDGNGGNDTIFGGDDDDRLGGSDGDDWLFGGDDDDALCGGAGNDLILGADDRDMISGGTGCDLIDGGDGRDVMSAGDGNDIFRLGAPRGDGDDRYEGGAGADTYLIVGAFDDDTIRDFSITEGDRLAIDNLDALMAMGPRAITMERSGCDRDDLEVTLRLDGDRSTLVLDEFFSQNAGFGSMPMRGSFTAQQTATIMHAIAVDAHADPSISDAQLTFQLGDLLAVFG